MSAEVSHQEQPTLSLSMLQMADVNIPEQISQAHHGEKQYLKDASQLNDKTNARTIVSCDFNVIYKAN